jgi:hypothetical protein
VTKSGKGQSAVDQNQGEHKDAKHTNNVQVSQNSSTSPQDVPKNRSKFSDSSKVPDPSVAETRSSEPHSNTAKDTNETHVNASELPDTPFSSTFHSGQTVPFSAGISSLQSAASNAPFIQRSPISPSDAEPAEFGLSREKDGGTSALKDVREQRPDLSPSATQDDISISSETQRKLRPESVLMPLTKDPVILGIALVDFDHAVSRFIVISLLFLVILNLACFVSFRLAHVLNSAGAKYWNRMKKSSNSYHSWPFRMALISIKRTIAIFIWSPQNRDRKLFLGFHATDRSRPLNF